MAETAEGRTSPGLRPGLGSGRSPKLPGGTKGSWPFPWQMVAAAAWLVFSLALAIWWWIYGMILISRLAEAAGASATADIERSHRMMMSEGATLIVLLLAGGISLLYYIHTEVKRSRKLREFFASFTHDMKTSLASLRLQAESLAEDMVEDISDDGVKVSQNPTQSDLLRRLVKDTVRLQLQLENSLLLASPDDSSKFLLETLRLSEVFESMRHHWPELEVEVEGDAFVIADRRAIESIFKNFLQNAVVHGRANRAEIQTRRANGRVHIRVLDDGRGFNGDRAKLGQMFERHGTSSGSGLGLYLAARLAEKMDGIVEFCDSPAGFCVEVILPEADPKAGRRS